MLPRLPIFAFIMSLSASASAGPPIAAAAAIDSIAARFSEVPVTGMTIGVMRDGKLVHVGGYGMAKLEGRVPARAGTVYEIGSITKQFTAAAILRLAEQGRLKLDDPVALHFPALANAAAGATLRHVLSHTSGIHSGSLVEDLTQPTDPSAIVALLAGRQPENAPAERYRYNNNGYILLGLLIERLTERRYGEHLEREFFRPLRLRSTAICITPRGAKVASAYEHPTRGDPRPKLHPIHHPTVSYASGAICSTAPDLLRWQHALVSGKVVSAASYAAMTTPATLKPGKSSPYGFGLFREERASDTRIHHGGASSGFVTQLGYYPSARVGIVVLTNGMYAPSIVEQIEADVADAVRGRASSATARPSLSEQQAQSVVGRYDLGPVKIDVFLQGTTLRAQPSGQVASRLLHQGNRVFIAEHDPNLRMAFLGSDTQADTLLLSQGDRRLPPAKRVLAAD